MAHWALTLPRMATSIQAGDGAEYALAAARGVLLHPPGFPIYALIADLLGWVYPSNPYAVMATFSAACQGIAVGGLMLLCFAVGRNILLATSIAIAWGLFEPVLRTATDAEVFGLHHILCLAVAGGSVLLLSGAARPRLGVFVLGIVCGLGGAHQPIILFWAPLAIGAVAGAGRRAGNRSLIAAAAALAATDTAAARRICRERLAAIAPAARDSPRPDGSNEADKTEADESP